jgi:hypothetical protein
MRELVLAVDPSADGRSFAAVADGVADELRGISASFSVAANRSSIGLVLSAMIGLQLRPLGGAAFLVIRLRRLFFSIELFFAMLGSWVSAFERLVSVSLPEREIECGQQGTRLVVGRAVVQTVMSMPHVSPALSKSISGKMMCSLMPSE